MFKAHIGMTGLQLGKAKVTKVLILQQIETVLTVMTVLTGSMLFLYRDKT